MGNIEKPWTEPGYTGKLKESVTLPCQPGYVEPTHDEKREILYTALAEDQISIDLFNTWSSLLAKQKHD